MGNISLSASSSVLAAARHAIGEEQLFRFHLWTSNDGSHWLKCKMCRTASDREEQHVNIRMQLAQHEGRINKIAETEHHYILECDEYAPIRKITKFDHHSLDQGLKMRRDFRAKNNLDLMGTLLCCYRDSRSEWVKCLELRCRA